MDGGGRPCQAINLSDSEPCTDYAVSRDGLFCAFHAKQCFGLYMGYKKRNARLDELTEREPEYLRESKTALANQTFEDIADDGILREVHKYLFDQYSLLAKVIAARRIHHKHFYPVQMDYGHQTFLNKLDSRRQNVLRALEAASTKLAKCLYEKEKWYDWIREAQAVEDAEAVKEQKKAKMETALWKRHWKEVQGRIKAAKAKEDQRRQDAFLDEVYQEAMLRRAAEATMEGDEYDDEWDPIEDVVQDERLQYLDLIRHFLWMEIPESQGGKKADATGVSSPTESGPSVAPEPKAPEGPETKGQAPDESGGGKKKNNKKKKKVEPLPALDKNRIETKEEMKKRLLEGATKRLTRGTAFGFQISGTVENPIERMRTVAPMPEAEVNQMLADVSEIRVLLFCRQLLSFKSLLPLAVEAGSVEEFLSNPNIPAVELRNLCLRVENPSLQAIRDACADFYRGDSPEEEGPSEDTDEDQNFTIQDLLKHSRYTRLLTPRSRGDRYDGLIEALEELTANAPGGQIPETIKLALERLKEEKGRGKRSTAARTRVTVCGKGIWDYASESRMSRRGWLQFSVMAKDCELEDAIELCRNWNEFFELNILALWEYFPASSWVSWKQDRLQQDLMQMGFIPYYMELDAPRTTSRHQVGGSRSGQARRAHYITEGRNFMCAYMKRNDPVTMRFIHYCIMARGTLLILVRDAKTGKTLTAPDDAEWWTHRTKAGYGRAAKNEWDIDNPINLDFFDKMDDNRNFFLSFEDYYEILVWDFKPGESPIRLHQEIIDRLRQARRIRTYRDQWKHVAPLLRTLHQEEDTKRVRQCREGEESIWEKLTGPDAGWYVADFTKANGQAKWTKDPVPTETYMLYNDADAAEDAALFGENTDDDDSKEIAFEEFSNPLADFEVDRLPPSVCKYLAEIEDDFENLRQFSPVLEYFEGFRDAVMNRPRRPELPQQLPEHPKGRVDMMDLAPPIWGNVQNTFAEETDGARKKLLDRTAWSTFRMSISKREWLHYTNWSEILDRDRAAASRPSFHLGDLQPNGPEKFALAKRLVDALQSHPTATDKTDWAWFILETLDDLALRPGDPDPYCRDVWIPFNHRYLIEDMTTALATLAVFFPNRRETAFAEDFVSSGKGFEFKLADLLDQVERAKHLGDRRTPTSCAYRPKAFWNEWNQLLEGSKHPADAYPMEWSLAVRPIIAKLYKAGVIRPSYCEPTDALGFGHVIAAEEPHRPGQLDMFINYEVAECNYPPNLVRKNQWPDVLPAARAFKSRCKTQGFISPRFAAIRVWSAPHFWPLMLGVDNQRGRRFLDSTWRGWEWKFAPKDTPHSEFSIHWSMGLRMDALKQQFKLGAARKGKDSEKGRRMKEWESQIVQRGDLMVVMGRDEEELLELAACVVFVTVTKPWFREVDLWRSFVNVDLKFLEGLDPLWLD